MKFPKLSALLVVDVLALVAAVVIAAGIGLHSGRSSAREARYEAIRADCNNLRQYELDRPGQFGASLLPQCLVEATQAKVERTKALDKSKVSGPASVSLIAFLLVYAVLRLLWTRRARRLSRTDARRRTPAWT